LCSLDTLLCIIIINILLLEYIILYWKTCWLPELILYRNIVSSDFLLSYLLLMAVFCYFSILLKTEVFILLLIFLFSLFLYIILFIYFLKEYLKITSKFDKNNLGVIVYVIYRIWNFLLTNNIAVLKIYNNKFFIIINNN